MHKDVRLNISNIHWYTYCIALVFITSFQGCSYDSKPSRKLNIPLDANWYGGPDGGIWIKVRNHQNDIFDITIYNDFTGDVIDSGYFKTCEGCNVNPDSIANLISTYDGVCIYLRQVVNDKYCYLFNLK